MDLYRFSSSSNRNGSTLFLSQIFYPTGIFTQVEGTDAYLVGWNLDNFRCFIACCCPITPISSSDNDSSLNSEEYVNLIENSLKHAIIELSGCLPMFTSSTPIILGMWKHAGNNMHMYAPTSSEQASSIWITITPDHSHKDKNPILHSVYSLGSIYYTSCYMIEYDDINTDSLEFMRLECNHSKSSHHYARKATRSSKDHQQDDYLSDSAYIGNTPSDQDIEVIINYVNAAYDLKRVVHLYMHDFSTPSTSIDSPYTQHPDTSININEDSSLLEREHEREVSFSTSTSILLFVGFVFDTFSNGFLAILESKHLFSWWSIGQILAHWVGLRGNDGIGSDHFLLGVSLSEISLSAVHVREKIYYYKIMIYQCLIFLKSWNKPAAFRSLLWRDLIRIMVFIWVDMILGIAMGYLIYRHEQLLCSYISIIYKFTEKQYLKEAIIWFNHNPGGVKLNSVITRRIGTALQYIINIFENLITTRVHTLHRPIILLITCIGSIGFTIQCMVIIDIIRLATLHVSTLHRCFGYQHKYQLELISSLYYLFYGKKKNFLRKRVDTCEYDSHQLLFGIALFTMVIFLFPTFAAYFYLFAVLDLMIVLVNYLLWILIVCLKEFPYYTLIEIVYYHIRNTRCVADGIQFQLTRIKADVPQHDTIEQSAITKEFSNKLKAASREKILPVSMKPALQSAMKKFSVATSSTISTRRGSKDDPEKVVNFSDQVYLDHLSAHHHIHEPVIDVMVDPPILSKPSLSFSRADVLSFVDEECHVSESSHAHQVVEGDSSESGDDQHGSLEASSNAFTTNDYEDIHVQDDIDDDLIIDESQQSSMITSASSKRFLISFATSTPTSLSARKIFSQAVKSSKLLLSSTSSPSSSSTSSAPGSTIYLTLSPKSNSLAQFYRPYSNYWEYFIKEKGLLWRIFRGMVHGKPSLDIQLIRATTDLSGIFRRPVTFKMSYFEIKRKHATSIDQNHHASFPRSSSDHDTDKDAEVILSDIDYYATISELADLYLESNYHNHHIKHHQHRWNTRILYAMLITCAICLLVISISTIAFISLCIVPYLRYMLSFRTARASAATIPPFTITSIVTPRYLLGIHALDHNHNISQHSRILRTFHETLTFCLHGLKSDHTSS